MIMTVDERGMGMYQAYTKGIGTVKGLTIPTLPSVVFHKLKIPLEFPQGAIRILFNVFSRFATFEDWKVKT